MKKIIRTSILFVLGAIAICAGCSKSDKNDKTSKAEPKKEASQVAARVNSTEITVSQINNALSRIQGIAPEATERTKRDILEKLIDAQIARDQAVAKKLDRTPGVLQALEASKTEILARAYMEQVATAQPKPTSEEAKKYYAEHPELFSQRRIYSIEEISLQSAEGLAAKLKDQVAKTKSIQDIAASLKSQEIRFAANRGVRAAEQIPFEILPQIQAIKDGDMQVFETAGGIQVIRVAASRSEPVDEARALPRIMQFLANRRATEAVEKDIKQIKEKTKIEYVGEFAVGAEEAQARAKAEAEAKAKAAFESKAKAAAESQAKEDALLKARREAQEKDRAEAEARAKAEEQARARRAAEAKERDAASKAPPQTTNKPLSQEIEKGLRGVIR